MNTNKSVERLVGDTLTDICFVMDYLQLGFSGLIVNSYSCPRIHIAGETVTFPDKGARDALCSFITHKLTDVEVIENVHLVLHFENGKIEIPLDTVSRKSGDAAEFIAGNNEPTVVF